MERESRHSKEEEEELDRKIAQIREKNQKIEERQKEIDADRASHADGLQRKPSKPSPPSSGATKTPKGEWDREWDHGKTPADTWRENVPSIETRKKPSGRGGHQWGPNQRGHRGGNKTRGRSEEPANQANKGSRLEGRVTVHPEQNAGNRRGRGRGGARNQARHVTKTDGELKISVKLGDESSNTPKHPRNTRQSAKSSSSNKDDQTTGQNTQAKNRPRRRYTEKYEIKQLLRALVNKVEKAERKERQQKQRQLKENATTEEAKAPPAEAKANAENTPPVVASEPVDGKKDAEAKVSTNDTAAVAAVKDEKEATKTEPTTKPPEAPVPSATETTDTKVAAAAPADANQNVIKLVEEKVLQIQMS
uniref:HABP4_PAI-RBP1 domain-containing protein n=1 Tax=Haemonchus contortus TaxID=6289 RepID=A0A7I4YYV6_HAECO|nr:Protein C10G8.8, isoform a [Haemonchus contortus]